MCFLVNTGAAVSVVPRSLVKGRPLRRSAVCLAAANGTRIETYGYDERWLDLGLRRPFKWRFIVAEVSRPILGADFLRANKLLGDVAEARLVQAAAENSLSWSVVSLASVSVPKALLHVRQEQRQDDYYVSILRDFLRICEPTLPLEPPRHGVVHRIETSGPPCFAKPRRMCAEKRKAAKAEFDKLWKLGLIWSSSSP